MNENKPRKTAEGHNSGDQICYEGGGKNKTKNKEEDDR